MRVHAALFMPVRSQTAALTALIFIRFFCTNVSQSIRVLNTSIVSDQVSFRSTLTVKGEQSSAHSRTSGSNSALTVSSHRV